MPPAHMNSAERRARRARRKKLRRNGRRLITAGWVVVVIAVLVAIVGLRDATDDGGGDDDVVTNDELVASAETTTSRRVRPSGVGAGGESVVIDLVPTTAPGTSTGGGGTSTADAPDVTGSTFGVRTPVGVVQVQAAPASRRPRPNVRPNVLAPASVARDANGDATITGITIVDADYPGSGDIGVALIGDGTITLTLNQDVQILGLNSSPFVGLAGPPAALNRALASVRFHREGGPTDLVVTVTDWAYGDLTRSQSGFAQIRIL